MTLKERAANGTEFAKGQISADAVRDRQALHPKFALPDGLAAISTMDRETLVAEWRRQFRSNPPDRIRRDLLELGIAWKLQEKALGGLKKAVAAELRNLAETLTRTGEVSGAKLPRLKPGVRIVREWGGMTHEVTVTDNGFLWEGKNWASLSAIAREITGAHWSGPRFFGLAAKSARASKGRKGENGHA